MSSQEIRNNKRKIRHLVRMAIVFLTLLLIALIAYQIPWVHSRLEWRLDVLTVYLRTLVKPVGELPTPIDNTKIPALALTRQELSSTATPPRSETQQITTLSQQESAQEDVAATMLLPPGKVILPAPEFEGEDWNNCGPATLAMYLRFYGWIGDQYTIAQRVKPKSEDRNVNVEELTAFVNKNTSGMQSITRVNGNTTILRNLISAGIPVMVEESLMIKQSFWLNDDRWAGHYLLITGYDDDGKTYITQDSYIGPDQKVNYEDLEQHWHAFNGTYVIIFPSNKSSVVKSILADDWEEIINRRKALEYNSNLTRMQGSDPFTWFNLGTNLLYFERYKEAAQAFDQARQLGLPQRMLRYQFGPFEAYYYANRVSDLLALTKYALGVTPNSEEALLWQGWALFQSGDRNASVTSFNKALDAHPGFPEALDAINYVQTH
jgi:hypothetical protein